MRLRDYAADIYSQSGEDGMLAEIFNRIGERERTCVEFGAGDGVSCSNTAIWRNAGWQALLIESDPARYAELVGFSTDAVRTVNDIVTPENLDGLLSAHGFENPDLMSIDVDGPDWLIFDAMQARPRVVVIEYNRSVPPGYDLRQADFDGTFGASYTALRTIATEKGYRAVAVTECNLILVLEEETEYFDDLAASDFDPAVLSYVVTDFKGNVAVLGDPPWGVAGPYLGSLVGAPIHDMPRSLPEMTGTVAGLRGAYEAIYGRAIYLDPGWHNVADPANSAAPRILSDLMYVNPPVILIDLSFFTPDDLTRIDWVKIDAEAAGYTYHRHGNLLVALLKEAA